MGPRIGSCGTPQIQKHCVLFHIPGLMDLDLNFMLTFIDYRHPLLLRHDILLQSMQEKAENKSVTDTLRTLSLAFSVFD